MASGYWSPLAIATNDGAIVTTPASATLCLPTSAAFTFPPNALGAGTMLRVSAAGRLSSVSGNTGRFDLRLNNLVFFDTGVLNYSTTTKTTLPWTLEVWVTCRATGIVGTASFMGVGNFQSEVFIGSPVGTAGGNGSVLSSVAAGPETAPTVTQLVDTTVSNPFTMFYTPGATTGSLTVHQFILESGAIALT